MRGFNLRSELGIANEDPSDPFWIVEGIPNAIMDYHSKKGSVLDFSFDDWKVCAEHDWDIEEVCRLCFEEYLLPDSNKLDIYLRRYFNSYDEGLFEDYEIHGIIENYYRWWKSLLPAIMKIQEEVGVHNNAYR